MKVIDEKGRLLGKINVVDFLVIIFFLSLTPMFYYGHKLMNKKSITPAMQDIKTQESMPTVAKEFIETELSFVFKKIAPDVLGLISVGDKEIGENKDIIGEIVSLGESVPYNYTVSIGNAKKVISDSVFKDLPVTLKIKADVRQYNLYYKDTQINDNSTIDFLTDKYKLKALYVSTLFENNNRTEDISDSIKIILQDQKEMEYAVTKLQNKVDFLEDKINSLENRMVLIEKSPTDPAHKTR